MKSDLLLRWVLLLGLLISASPTSAADPVGVMFDAPRDALIRMRTNSLVRGQIVAVGNIEIVMNVEVPSTGATHRRVIPLSRIRYFRTLDNQLAYEQGDEIADMLKSAAALSGAKVLDFPEGSGGLGSADQLTIDPDQDPLAPAGEANGTKVLILCSQCGQEVETVTRDEKNCPICGIVWKLGRAPESLESRAEDLEPEKASVETTPVALATEPVTKKEDPKPAEKPEKPKKRNPAPAAQAPLQIQAPPPPPVFQQAPQELNMANLPVWMKVGLFVGIAAVGYLAFFNRR